MFNPPQAWKFPTTGTKKQLHLRLISRAGQTAPTPTASEEDRAPVNVGRASRGYTEDGSVVRLPTDTDNNLTTIQMSVTYAKNSGDITADEFRRVAANLEGAPWCAPILLSSVFLYV